MRSNCEYLKEALRMYVYVYMYIYVCTYMCMRVYISVCMCVCMADLAQGARHATHGCVCVYECICICMYECESVHSHNTLTKTNLSSQYNLLFSLLQ